MGRTYQSILINAPAELKDVSHYVGRVSVHPVTEDGGTFVERASAWEKNDQAAGDVCHGIYVALLGDMKKSLEH